MKEWVCKIQPVHALSVWLPLSCVTGDVQMESGPIKTEFLSRWPSAFWQIEDGIWTVANSDWLNHSLCQCILMCYDDKDVRIPVPLSVPPLFLPLTFA